MGFSLKKTLKKAGAIAINPTVALGTLGAKKAGDKAMGALGMNPEDFPAPPGMSPQEAALYAKQLEVLEQQRKGIDDGLALYDRASGLYNPDGSINTAALDRLRGVDTMALDRYERALRGDVAPSIGLQQEEEEAFRQFRTQQARMGGGVQGNSFGSATAGTTAGNQRLMGFGKNFALRRDSERRSELNDARLRLGAGANTTTGRTAITSGYAPLAMGFSSAAQPFQAQRELGYNARLAKYGAKRSDQNALMGFGTNLLSAALLR